MPITAEPTRQPGPTSTSYSNPSDSDLAAVAATVSVVGVLMALLIAWLAVRLRHAANSQSTPIPIVSRRPVSNASYIFRPSFAPSEASSKFGFTRKPLRLSSRRQDGSWDFADPDPFSYQKECSSDPPVRTPSQKHRPAPLTPAPACPPRAHCASTHNDESCPHTPTTPSTPASMDCLDPPPSAYCRESSTWPVYQYKVISPS